MYAKKQMTEGAYRQKVSEMNGSGENIPLYEDDELDVLREELLEAYATAREKMLTRDEAIEIRRTEFALRESARLLDRKVKDENVLLEIKAKQDALKRLYENVLSEKEKTKKRREKTKEKQDSVGSFHQMYAIYHDPVSGEKAKVNRGDSATEPALIVVEATPQPPSKGRESGDNAESAASGKERSKFVLKQRLSSLKSKPPPLLDGMKGRTSRDVRNRKDARYSETKDRYSFDVDIVGPFVKSVDEKKQAPTMRSVATQAMIMMDDGRNSADFENVGSQTDVEINSWSGRKFSRSTDRSGTSWGENFEFDETEDDLENEAGGDASSSNPSEKDENEEAEDEHVIFLERKESKRREAETMTRPRGYRDLDLKVALPFVSFEAETHVTAHDLEKEEAKRRGITLSRDNILWPTCSEFDMDTISKRIEDYIKRCWKIDVKWMFIIQPSEVYHDNYRKKYVFEVQFSIPSPTTPVPPATASVFFVFEIPLYSMKDDTVKVTYVLEGTRYPHNPGKIPFQDKWLWGIISDKLRVQKAVNF